MGRQVAGRSDRLKWLRDDGQGTRVNRKNIIEAVDKSLKRLDTDYIDLLQVRRIEVKVAFWSGSCALVSSRHLRRVLLRRAFFHVVHYSLLFLWWPLLVL